LGFALIFLLMVLLYKWVDDKSIIQFILKFAGITYGPLLGLFAFGILTKRRLRTEWLWMVCVACPLLALGLDLLCNPEYYNGLLHTDLGLAELSLRIFDGYKIGPELILLNGLITFSALFLISRSSSSTDSGPVPTKG
jgi:hypothetical protein